MHPRPIAIEIDSLTLRYGERLIQRDLSFSIHQGDIFIIMGGSGCGKSTLLRHLIGLQTPAAGSVRFAGVDLWQADDSTRQAMQRRFGVLFQSGALWSSLTLSENIMLPMTEIGGYRPADARELAAVKLALVGLAGFENFYPSEISGGMKKRAALARAMALDPDILFFDEPSAGLDPLSSALLDELILELRESLGATIIIVTHELASIFAIGDNSVFLDAETRTMIAQGDPKELRHSGPEGVRNFLGRGKM
ncbi:ABC transporter ATP-binding protein [Azonexus sp.]|uniref:ABC transporter ATP-binding protein n=1 Tax=Azonexus sp. TaxID=1872668 RepID=UPI0039E64F51